MDVEYTIGSDPTVQIIRLDGNVSVRQFVDAVARRHRRPDLRYVFYDGALVSEAEDLLDWIGPGVCFHVSPSMDASEAPPRAPVAPPAAPPPARAEPPPAREEGRAADAAPDHAGVITLSKLVVLPVNLRERLKAIQAGRMRVYLTTTYDLMVNGQDVDIDFGKDTRDVIVNKVRTQFRIPPTQDVHLYFSTGLRFTDQYKGEPNTMIRLFGEIHGLKFKLYAVVTRRIDPRLLAAPVPEVCSCVGDMKQLLSPVWDTASDVGFSRMACLMGYLRYGGTKAEALIRALAAVTDFAPLVCGCCRVMESGVEVDGLTIATVAAAFLCVTEVMAPADVPQPQLAEQVLLTACWLVHIRSGDALPDTWSDPVTVRQAADSGDFGTYAEATGQDNLIFCYTPDTGEEYFAFELQKPKADDFRGLFENYVSFRPTPPLSLRLMSGVIFIRHTNEVTLLKLGEIRDADPGNVSNRISLIDPRTARKRSVDIDELAEVRIRRDGDAYRTIDGRDVDELICICVDFSGSMSRVLEGNSAIARKSVPDAGGRRPVVGDSQRLEYAWQYTVSFVHRLFGFRIPCLIAIMGFNQQITFETDLLPVFNDTDSLIRDKAAHPGERRRFWAPSGDTHLWDAIDHARGKLLAAKRTGRYPRANCRIVVFADGDDAGSVVNPANLSAQLKTDRIIVDSVAVSLCQREVSPGLAKLSHATGGFAFRPANGELGMRIFEKEPFLSVRKRPSADIRGTTFEAASEKFDPEEECNHEELLTCRQPIRELVTIRFVLSQDAKNRRVREGRELRILRELRGIFRARRPDLKVYCPPDTISQWRVFLEGPHGSFYGGGWWHIFAKFPDLYPDQPPEIRFVVVPYHPNISEHGRVCRQILFEGYRPDTGMLAIFDDLKEMLVSPDSELAMAVGVDKRLECRLDAAQVEAFRRRAQDSAGRASETVDEYLIGVVRGPKDDPDFVDRGGDGPPVRDPVIPAFLRDIEPLAIFDARGEPLVPLGDDDMI